MGTFVLVLARGYNSNGNEVCFESRARFGTVDNLRGEGVLFITVDGKKGRRTLARVMCKEAVRRGWRSIERTYYREEGSATNTDFEIRMFAKQLKQIGAKGRVVIASSRYHMFRVKICQRLAWKHAGLDIPVEFRHTRGYGWTPYTMLYEGAAILQYFCCWVRHGVYNTRPTDPLEKQRPRA